MTSRPALRGAAALALLLATALPLPAQETDPALDLDASVEPPEPPPPPPVEDAGATPPPLPPAEEAATPPPLPPETTWFIEEEGAAGGPYTLEELRTRAAAGTLAAGDPRLDRRHGRLAARGRDGGAGRPLRRDARARSRGQPRGRRGRPDDPCAGPLAPAGHGPGRGAGNGADRRDRGFPRRRQLRDSGHHERLDERPAFPSPGREFRDLHGRSQRPGVPRHHDHRPAHL
jgi:hypothetical protein